MFGKHRLNFTILLIGYIPFSFSLNSSTLCYLLIVSDAYMVSFQLFFLIFRTDKVPDCGY